MTSFQDNLCKLVPRSQTIRAFCCAARDNGGGVVTAGTLETSKAPVKLPPPAHQRILFWAVCPSCHPVNSIKTL